MVYTLWSKLYGFHAILMNGSYCLGDDRMARLDAITVVMHLSQKNGVFIAVECQHVSWKINAWVYPLHKETSATSNNISVPFLLRMSPFTVILRRKPKTMKSKLVEFKFPNL